MNWSLSVSWRWENSGIEITPYSFKQKSPNALAIANPGASSKGNHTLGTSGSSCKANTLPLQRLILSASPIRISNQFSIRLYLHKSIYSAERRINGDGIWHTWQIRLQINCQLNSHHGVIAILGSHYCPRIPNIAHEQIGTLVR